MSSADTYTHVRELNSIFAVPERRALEWMASRMPPWINSDHLTLLGLFGMAMAGGAYWAASWNRLALLAVLPALAVNWFGDSLDGTLARVRQTQRPRYGFYVDHVIDIVGCCFLLGGLALSSYMSPLIAVSLLAAHLMVFAELYLSTHVCGVFRMSFLKMGPTELRILLAIGTLSMLRDPWVRLGESTSLLLFDVGGGIATIALVVTFLTSTLRTTSLLYRAEPVRPAHQHRT
jgi:phosphatidylglycerophosphate synthase